MSKAKRLARALFGIWPNAALSVVMVAGLGYIATIAWRWAVAAATFIGASRTDCAAGGACWAFIATKLKLFLYGNFPEGAEWRVHLALVILLLCLLGTILAKRGRGWWLLALLLSAPVNALLLGGGFAGLTRVSTSDWGGLMLNITLAFVAIGFSIPIGIGLAFLRLSKNKRLAWVATVFVEFWRAVPHWPCCSWAS